ncbi:hypothetical protein ACFQ07_25225, partial [Actinomadura adrarensis]
MLFAAVSEAAALRQEPDWDTGKLRTHDSNTGGVMQWDRETGTMQVCDTAADDRHARLVVTSGSETVFLMVAQEKGTCEERALPDYTPSEKRKYIFELCLVKEGAPIDCNQSSNLIWPVGVPNSNPKARVAIDARPDDELRRARDGAGLDNVAEPLVTLLRMVLWFAWAG